MGRAIDETALDTLFYKGRTFSNWLDKPVSDDVIKKLYELSALGPTSANSSPARFVFIRTSEEKEKLAQFLEPLNKQKMLAAPVVVIVAEDRHFYEEMPKLFPARPEVRDVFASKPMLVAETAARNTALEGGYMIMAARALGLDCGPMSGFSREGVDKAYFPDGRWASNFLCNIGYGDPEGVWPRNPRLPFEDACRLL